MSNIVALFDSVLNSFLQSFVPIVDQHFHEFDIQISSRKYSKDELDSFLEKAFISFPRTESSYSRILAKLTSFATSNPNFIIGHLCSKLSNELNRKADSLPTLQIITLLTYRGTNYHHYMFVHYLIIIILSDLLLKIISKFSSSQFEEKIVKIGFNLCASSTKLHFLQNLLIDTWSYIFYYVSLSNLKYIAQKFNAKINEEDSNKIIKLIRRISGNQGIADSILQSFIQIKKKKALTSEYLLNLSFLLARIDCNAETLSEFFKIIWELKGTDELKYGIIIMISVLFNRVPTQSKKILQFYQTRVYKHAQNDKKVERSLQSFLILIRGDISKVPGPGDDSDPLSYISTTRSPLYSSPTTSSPSSQKQKNQNNSESYITTFMKVFFPKSNFFICPIFFRDVLIQLASIDINEFTSFLLPKFVSLNHDDFRLHVLLTVIPFLNQSDFIERSYCHATKQQISIINQSIQKIILEQIPFLQTSGKEQQKTINYNSSQFQSIIDESNRYVNDFIQRNNFTLFEYNHNDKQTTEKTTLSDQNNQQLILTILKCIKITFTNDDFLKSPEIIETIIELSCSCDQLISEAASSICFENFNDSGIQPLFIKQATNLIFKTNLNEVWSKSLQFLSFSIYHLKDKLKDEKEINFYELEAASLVCLTSNYSYCRALALNLFKQIISLKPNSEVILHQMVELNDSINEKVKHFMMILNVPEKPFVSLPLIGHINFESACYSKYNDLWIINYSEILNIIIDLKLKDVLKIINTNLQNQFDLIRKTAKQRDKTDKQKSKKKKVNSDEKPDYDFVSFFLCFLDTFSSGADFTEKPPESLWYIEKVDKICKKVIKFQSMTIKRSFITSFRFLNWRVIPTVLHSAINIDTNLYSDVSEALSLIIQNPMNNNKIFSHVFRVLIPYLNSFQTYFKDIQINGMSEMKWNESLFKKLKQNEKMCINYCIIISVAFKKLKSQISEDKWPVSYRQVHARFLTNWGQLPSVPDFNFEKLKAYSVDALIPILKSGTIFTNGFEFDLSILDMLIQCKLSDYSVLDSLLFFHSDILLGEFIKQVLLEPQRESQIFLNSIVSTLKKLDDSVDIQQWGGAFVLLAIFCYEQMNDEAWRFILQKLAVLLLSERKDSDTVQMISNADNISFALTVFQFLTEQFIQFSFEVIKLSQKAVVVKMIVNFLKPWIEKLRILPTQGFIMPGIPTKYRIFSVLTFFNEILSLSQSLNDEQLDVFSQVWYNLLKSSDNNVIVLLLLFEYEKNDIKQKIFEKLLDKDPKMITKFLIKRCSFAFWYFIKTQRKINLNFQFWMMKVLSRSFIDYRKEATKMFVFAFHYSLLFIEKAGDLFNALIEVLNLEPVDSAYVWTLDTDIENTMGVTSIISKSINKIKSTNPKAIEKWSREATRWAVSCNDLRIAYRSLVILNCLENSLEQPFTLLLSNAVLYFLNHACLIAPNLSFLSNMTSPGTATEPEVFENENEEDKNEEIIAENVTFNLNLDENHQFNSSSSKSLLQSEGIKTMKKIQNDDENDDDSSISTSMSIDIVSSSESELNAAGNDEISCYFSHNEETIDSENIISSIEDVSLYVSECFKLLNRHFEEKGIAQFALKFASTFIHYRPFLRNCLGNALPLFLSCYSEPSLSEIFDTRLIIDAFIPFSRSLESSRKSQELFVETIIKTKAPELYIVASAFLPKNHKETDICDMQFHLPIIDIGMTYEEIMMKKYNQDEIKLALTVFSEILKTCSKQLSNSIFFVSNELLLKYGKTIDKTPFVPIYGSALSLIAVFNSAANFVETVSLIAPSIMSLKYNEWPPDASSFEDVKSSISDISKRLNIEFNKIKNKNKNKNSNLKNKGKPFPLNLNPQISPRKRLLRSNSNSSSQNEKISLSSTAKSPISSSKTIFKPPSPKITLTRSSSKSSFSRFSAGDASKDKSNLLEISIDYDNQDEIVPITECKEIQHLIGLIDQRNPPKIIPFASHYEMIIGLTKEVKKKMKMKLKEEKLFSKKKYTSSSFAMASQMLSNKSIVMALTMQTKGLNRTNLPRLKKMTVNNMELEMPFEEDNNRDKFIVPFSDFLKLNEENSSEMSTSSMMGKRRKKKKLMGEPS